MIGGILSQVGDYLPAPLIRAQERAGRGQSGLRKSSRMR